jgi:hypothetical protein
MSSPATKAAKTQAVKAAVEVAEHTPLELEEIARLAYSYWEARGRPDGSSQEDWFRAEREIRKRTGATR